MTKTLLTGRETVLMACDADLSGSLNRIPIEQTCKYFQVTQWNSPDDEIAWTVLSESNADFDVTMLVKGRNARISVKCNGEQENIPVNSVWDRVQAPPVHIKQGVNRIVLKATDPGEGLEIYSLELITAEDARRREARVRTLRSDTQWMRTAGYGVQCCWTNQACPRIGLRKPYNAAVEAFDVEGFVRAVAGMGVGYVIMTTSHDDYYIQAPIAAVDRVLKGRTSSRDLIADLIAALNIYGIKLLLYYHIGHGDYYRDSINGWWAHTGYLQNKAVFWEHWQEIIGEIGERYGNGLAGWFFDDGCAYYPLNPDFDTLTSVAKNGNPDRVICYNPWIWPRMTDFQDYFCGEGYDFLRTTDYLTPNGNGIFTGGPQKGLQAHTNFILERNWWHDKEDTPIDVPQIPLAQFQADMKRAFVYGIVPSVNLEIYQEGAFSDESVRYMQSIKHQQ
jgi:hypothetical protein